MATGSWTGTSPRGVYKPAMNEKEGTTASGAWKNFDTSLTNIHNKLWRDNVINVKSDYEAVGDGSTDDTTAIQTALATGQSLYFPGNSSTIYLVSSALVPQAGTHWIGEGATIKLKDSSDCNIVEFTSATAGVTFDGLIFDGNGTNQTRADTVNIIEASEAVTKLTIKNCEFKNSAYNSIRLENGYAHGDIEILDSRFYDYDSTAIQIYQTTDGIISRNQFDNTSITLTAIANGISVVGSSNITTETNSFDMSASGNANHFAIEYNNSDFGGISNNTIDGNDGTYCGGISLTSGAEVPIAINTVRNVKGAAGIEVTTSTNSPLTGNKIYYCKDGIEVTGICYGISISGGVITGWSQFGIYMGSPGTPASYHSNSIVGVSIIDAQANASHAIYFNGAGNYCVAANNTIENCSTGRGVQVDTSSEFPVTGMNIQGNIITNMQYAFYVGSTYGTNFIVAHNVCKSNTTAPVFGGTGHRIIDNEGLDETVTAASPTLQHWGYTEIDSTDNVVDGTLGSGQYIGQIKTIVMTEASNASTVTVTNHNLSDGEVFDFDAVDDTLVLLWNGTEWITLGEEGVGRTWS